MTDQSLAGKFDQKLDEEYRRRTAIGIVPGIIVVSATWIIFYNSIESHLWKISGILILAALVSRALMDKFLYSDKARNLLYFRIIKSISVLTAFGWGSACFSVISEKSIISIEALTIMMVNVANASSVSYAMSPIDWLRRTYLFVSLLPLSLAVFVTSDSWQYTMYGVMTLLFVNYLLSISSKQKSTLILSYELNEEVLKNTVRLEAEQESLRKALMQLRETQEDLMNERAKTLNSERLAFLGSMAAGVAHEINNPLTISGGQVYRIESLLIQEPTRELLKKISGYLEKISEMNGKIRNIVRGLQYFSRERKIDPPELFPLTELIELSSHFFSERMRSNDIEFSGQKPPIIEIYGQKNELSQALFNLLDNAIEAVQAVPHRKVSITFEIVLDELEIRIADNGIGINSDIKDRVFDPFFTTKDVGKGTGLGLSIARGIIQSHRGSLDFTSTLGSTVFVIKLPIALPQHGRNCNH